MTAIVAKSTFVVGLAGTSAIAFVTTSVGRSYIVVEESVEIGRELPLVTASSSGAVDTFSKDSSNWVCS